MSPREDNTRRGIYSAAFLASQHRLPVSQRVPLVTSLGEWSGSTFGRWMELHMPDVLIIQENKIISDWLRKMKKRVPRDISIFSTAAGGTSFVGLRADMHALGESAVEMVSLLLERDQIGKPKSPRTWLVEDTWQKGNSLKFPITDL